MTYLQLLDRFETRIFTLLDVRKIFWEESESLIRVQLSRFAKRGLITSLKRGLYCFAKKEIDPFTIANQIYQPSYISLESALNYHGVIPDVPLAGVTSVSPTTTRKFITPKGTCFFQKISSKLFWGYNEAPFKMAFPEKALLDYEYFYGKKSGSVLRIDWSKIDKKRYSTFKKYYD